MATRVVISGYYGMQNFGDEAILEQLIAVLQRVPDVQITVFSNSPQETGYRYNVNAVPRSDLLARISTLRHADVLILGGGGLIKEILPRGGVGVGFGLLDGLLAILLNTPFLVFGVGVGQIRSPRGWEYVRRILSHAAAVWVRDKTSFHRLSEAGVAAKKLHLGADIVFGFDQPPRAKPKKKTSPRVGLSLPDADLKWLALQNPKCVSKFMQALSQGLVETFGPLHGNLVLIGLQDVSKSRDLIVLQHLSSGMGSHLSIESVNLAKLSLDEALDVYSGLDFLVGMRFHSIVLAVMTGIPFFALSLDEKVLNLMKDLNALDWCFDLCADNPAIIKDRIHSAWNRRFDIQNHIKACSPQIRKRALNAEEFLFRYLCETPLKPTLGQRANAFMSIKQLLIDFAIEKLRYRNPRRLPIDYQWSVGGKLGRPTFSKE